MRKLFLVTTVVVMVAALGVAVACSDDEPSEEEARAALCGDLEQLDVAVDTLLQLDAQSTVGEVRAARDNVSDAVEEVQSSAEDVPDAETGDLQLAYDDLNETIENIQDDQTIQEVLDAVTTAAENVAAAEQQLFDLSCEGATPTGEAEPTEAATEAATDEPTAAETVPVETAAPTESAEATETAAPTDEAEPTEPVPTAEGG